MTLVYGVIQKNTPTRKSQYLRNARTFLHEISIVCCLGQNCSEVCCYFVLYLLHLR